MYHLHIYIYIFSKRSKKYTLIKHTFEKYIAKTWFSLHSLKKELSEVFLAE